MSSAAVLIGVSEHLNETYTYFSLSALVLVISIITYKFYKWKKRRRINKEESQSLLTHSTQPVYVGL